MSTNDPGMVPPPPASPAPRGDDPQPPAPPYGAPAAPGYAAPQEGAPQYGAPQYAAPGQVPGYPGTEPAPRGGKGFAITALVLSLVALALSWVPIVNNVAAVLAVVALVFGVIALVGAVRKGRPGKGMAIASLVVSVVAFVLVLVTQAAYSRAIDEFVEGVEDGMTEPLDGTGSEATTAPEESAAAEPAAEEAAAAQDVVLVDVAFGQRAHDPTTWWYVAIVENPNPTHVFPFADFTVEAVGADGTILDSSPDYRTMLPGRTALSGVFLEVGGNAVDHVDVRGPVGADAVAAEEVGAFAVAELAATSDEWSTTVGGTLSSDFADEQSNVGVTVVATAPDGRILGAEWTLVDRLPVGGQARFETRFPEPLPADTTYTAYPSP
ncbi:DUF4190 domain-containing protein [Cellulomonas sp.]|uniref:DUF4190 domain-containing protein n=1 Tax=Cellulomonas sp. TaxID=40001 RepID=UPI0028115DD4|nr:hypothetical protein [Cellulomonas sp.]